MAARKLLSVGDFAKMSRVTLVMLHHYDKIGLLSPVSRGENNYRYYSLNQLSEVKLIRTMQELGMSLREIKALKERRNPERTVEMLRRQIEKIEEKALAWASARKLINGLLAPILSVQDIDESAISIQYLPAEPLVLGGWNEYAEDEDGYDALVVFFRDISKKYPGIEMNYPIWGLFSRGNAAKKMAGEHTWPERYYFYMPEGPDERPAGFYAVGYARGGYGQNDELYMRMRDYIQQNGFELCGDAYEEYPLNEICVTDSNQYLMRVLITVSRNT